ncbi:uncharacterized protein [Haliotis cracherodii]|uniref:uncharacterized protein n=1 Tax=Haliotis cracherodii TaxID=6455 RepID=UPI0039E95804
MDVSKDLLSHFNAHHSPICRLCDRYTQFNSTGDRPRIGRPRVTTPSQDRYIRLFHLRNSVFAMPQLRRLQAASHGLRRISDQTVRNHLREAGIRTRRPVIVPVCNISMDSDACVGVIPTALEFEKLETSGNVTANRSMNQIVESHLLPTVDNQLLQQDNAPPHTACVTVDYLPSANIYVMLWPSISQDANPI